MALRFHVRWVLALALITVLLGAGGAAETVARDPAEGDDPSIQVDPIRIAKDARTERDYLKAQRAWAERALIAPFRERAKGARWEQPALDFVGSALEVWPGDRSSAELPELSRRGQALQAEGCEDPLVGYLTMWARWLSTEEYYGSREAFQKWMNQAEKLPGTHVLAVLCGTDFFQADTVVKVGVGDFPKRYLRLTAESWTDGGYLPEEDFLFVRHLFQDRRIPFFNQHFDGLWGALKPLALPPWAADTILGEVEIERAWKQRGAGMIDTVTPEMWAGFEEHLGKARRALVRAWKARPDQPVAPTAMIRLTMGLGGGHGEDDPRLWFDRAVAAQCDYEPAYGQYVVALTPRWLGSFTAMVKLAQACADTARYDTEVPRRAVTVLARANEEVSDLWRLYHRPEVAPLLLSVFRGYVAEPGRASAQKTALADLAVYAHVAGDAHAAGDALAQYGAAPLPHPATVLLHELGIDENALRGHVALLSGELRPDFAEAAKADTEKRFADAQTAYEALLPRATGPAAARLRGLAQNAAFEAKLATGEWAAIPPDPTLAGWIQRSGAWHANADGMPAIQDADGPVRIVYGAPVGANFEMRATLKIEGEPRARWFQGLVFGDRRRGQYWAKWNGAFVRFDKGRQTGTARSFFREFVTSLPAVDCPLREVNEFTLRVEHAKLSWTVNGQPIHHEASMEGLSEEDRIGFGSFKHTSGITTSLQKLEVRRLPAE